MLELRTETCEVYILIPCHNLVFSTFLIRCASSYGKNLEVKQDGKEEEKQWMPFLQICAFKSCLLMMLLWLQYLLCVASATPYNTVSQTCSH